MSSHGSHEISPEKETVAQTVEAVPHVKAGHGETKVEGAKEKTVANVSTYLDDLVCWRDG